MPRIFEYQSARRYMQDWIQEYRGIRSGLQSKLAKIAGCKPSFISQVLAGKSYLSLEQGEKISRFLQLAELEENYFLLLILWEKAGTPQLKEKLEKQLQSTREKSLNLSKRLNPIMQTDNPANDTLAAQYYSSWIYPALHVAIGIKKLQTPYALAQSLRLDEERVREALEFLKSANLVEEKKGEYSGTPFTLHLGKDSLFLAQHHRNLHNLSIRLIDDARKNDLQYSGFMTLSQHDAHRIKESLAAEIKKCIEIAKLSNEEEVHLVQIGTLKLC